MKKLFITLTSFLILFNFIPLLHAAAPPQPIFGEDGKIIQLLDATGLASGFSEEQIGTSAPEVAVNIINAILTLFGIVFTFLLIYGGWLWMTAAGNQDHVDKAKKVLQWAVIGIAIVMVSVSISVFVSSSLIKATGGSL